MPSGTELAEGAAAALAVRPEKLVLSHAPPAGFAIAATVSSIGYLGGGSIVHLATEQGMALKAYLPGAAAGRLGPRHAGMGELAARGGRGPDAMTGLGWTGRLVLIGVPFLWLALFFLLPLLIVVKISLAESTIGIPPYTPLFANDGSGLKLHATLANFALIASDDLYLRAYLGSLGNAALATASLPSDRLSDCLRHCPLARGAAAAAAVPRHAAVLDELSDPRLRLDRDPRAERVGEPVL